MGGRKSAFPVVLCGAECVAPLPWHSGNSRPAPTPGFARRAGRTPAGVNPLPANLGQNESYVPPSGCVASSPEMRRRRTGTGELRKNRPCARQRTSRNRPVLSRRTGNPRRPIPRMPPHPNPAGDDSGARSWFPVCQQGFFQFAPRGTPENTDIPHAQHGGKEAKCHFSGFFT